MTKEKREQLTAVIEAYQEVLFKKKRNDEPIDWQSVDSFLSFLRNEIKTSDVRIKLNKEREVRKPIEFGDVDGFLRHIQRKLEE